MTPTAANTYKMLLGYAILEINKLRGVPQSSPVRFSWGEIKRLYATRNLNQYPVVEPLKDDKSFEIRIG